MAEPQIHTPFFSFYFCWSLVEWAAEKNGIKYVEHGRVSVGIEIIVFKLRPLGRTTAAECYSFFNFINHHLCTSFALIYRPFVNVTSSQVMWGLANGSQWAGFATTVGSISIR